MFCLRDEWDTRHFIEEVVIYVLRFEFYTATKSRAPILIYPHDSTRAQISRVPMAAHYRSRVIEAALSMCPSFARHIYGCAHIGGAK